MKTLGVQYKVIQAWEFARTAQER